MAASSNLHAAAEALAKAALEEGQVAALAELKRGAAASQATSDKLDTLINLAEIQTLQSAIKLLNTLDPAKQSSLYGIHTFVYSLAGQDRVSTYLVGEILARAFMCRTSMRLGGGAYYIGTADAKGEAAFNAKLSEIIQLLTGTKPRIVKEMQADKVEQWVIYRK